MGGRYINVQFIVFTILNIFPKKENFTIYFITLGREVGAAKTDGKSSYSNKGEY